MYLVQHSSWTVKLWFLCCIVLLWASLVAVSHAKERLNSLLRFKFLCCFYFKSIWYNKYNF